MAEGVLPISADELSIRRWLSVTYTLMAQALNRRSSRPPEELASWVHRARRRTSLYDERTRQWGRSNCWTLASHILQSAHFLGKLADHQVVEQGCRIHLRLLSALAPEVARRCGTDPADERRTLRSYNDLAGREYDVGIRWEMTGDGAKLWLRHRGPLPPDARGWSPDPPEQQPALGRHLVARYLGILLGYAYEVDEMPEQVGRLMATRLGPLLAPACVWEQLGPVPTLARVAAALHLGLLDQAQVESEEGGRLIQSHPLAPDTAGVLQVYGVLPHDLGRFFNGLLQALGAPHHLRVASEIGQSTFHTRIRER